jgi:energy-coupling factor transporter ATP-binding protein EcfA2
MNPYFYESFNARNYTPEQVAETFIPNEDYENLFRNEHTVVLGPRGSGKTTLFKMLTVQALYAWAHPTAELLRKERPFTAIYVPTDMHWHHQLKHAEEHLQLAPRFSAAASRAAVTTSILLAVARTFQSRLKYEISNSPISEAELCAALIKEWDLSKVLPCLDAVILALKSRIGEIRRLVNEAIFRNSPDETIQIVPSYFHTDFFAQVDIACSTFDHLYRPTQGPKWAICLDELELAPAWLQSLAFSQQRSTDENYLIKLSTSPIPRALGSTESRPNQDLRLISIWNHANRQTDKFAEELALSILQRRLGVKASPEALFGRSDLVLEAEESVKKYERGSPEWILFRELATWDTTFNQMLMDHGLDPSDPVSDAAAVRDAFLRKAKPVAMLRRAFLKPTGEGKLSLRSRKLGTIYYGKDAIYRISDGNPRRLIGILGDLCSALGRPNLELAQPLSENEQAEVLTRASLHFSGYVHALPGGTTSLEGHDIDLATLLRVIGDFFRQKLLGSQFLLDPPGTFTVDSHINDKIIELLRLGVYHGALVHVDPVPDTIETSLRGKRFRLSYMLAPLYKLPLRIHESISLTSVLRSSGRLRVRRAIDAISQQSELKLDKSD